jgi:hypothetical protein
MSLRPIRAFPTSPAMPALALPRSRRIDPVPAAATAAPAGAPGRWLALLVVGLLLATFAFATRGPR